MPPRCVEPAPPPKATPLDCPSRATWPSYSMPSGLVPNTKAFWLSLKVSKTITTESVSFSDASRRDCDTMIFEGSASKQMMLTYTLPLPTTMRTSVFSEAGAPSVGSCCVKSANGFTVCQTASVTRPSMMGASALSSRLADGNVLVGVCARACVASKTAVTISAIRADTI